MDVSSTPLHCPYGTIGHIKDFGVIPAGSDTMDYCLNNKLTQSCQQHLPAETRTYI